MEEVQCILTFTFQAKMDLFDEQIIEFVEAKKYLYSSKDPAFKDM